MHFYDMLYIFVCVVSGAMLSLDTVFAHLHTHTNIKKKPKYTHQKIASISITFLIWNFWTDEFYKIVDVWVFKW